jgi:hypothetical protein
MLNTNQLEYGTPRQGIWAYEVRTSRPVGGESAELHFILEGTSDESLARSNAEAALVEWDVLSFDGKPLVAVALKPDYINADPDSGPDFGRWVVTATYSRRAFTPPAMVDPATQAKLQAIDFDISGERRHITQSLFTEYQCVPAGKQPIDFGGAIRVKKNGQHLSVEGTDIVVSHESFSLSKTVPTSLITPGMRAQLKAMVSLANLNPFTITLNGQADTYQMGELRFMGATGKAVEGLDRTDVVFKFEDNKTLFDVKIGTGANQISVPRIGGFELLWVSYQEKETSTTMTVVPIQANVERVVDLIDFGPLTSLGVQ